MKAQQARENPAGEPQRSCEGVSRVDEPCNLAAEVYCEKCERWFCGAHAQDDLWHPCILDPGDDGGEG